MTEDGSLLSVVLSIIAVLASLAGLWFTDKQWRRISRKIGMISEAGVAMEVLPAWYTGRMMQDEWQFGLLTDDASVIAISRITGISDDGKWMDVELLTREEVPKGTGEHFVTAVAEDRRRGSVQIDKIILAYDLVTS